MSYSPIPRVDAPVPNGGWTCVCKAPMQFGTGPRLNEYWAQHGENPEALRSWLCEQTIEDINRVSGEYWDWLKVVHEYEAMR